MLGALLCPRVLQGPHRKEEWESQPPPPGTRRLWRDGTLLRERIITACVKEGTVWNRQGVCSEEVEVSLVGKGTVSGSLSGVSQLLIE